MMRVHELIRGGHRSTRPGLVLIGNSLEEWSIEDRFRELKEDLAREFCSDRIDQYKKYLCKLLGSEKARRERWIVKMGARRKVGNKRKYILISS
jgi:hypothetical protein